MKNKKIDASIILSSFNNLDSLKLSIKSLMYAKKVSQYDFEVIIADDGSTDGTVEYLQSENIKHCTHNNNGYRLAKTWNEGTRITEGSSQRFIFGNSDIIWNPHFIDVHCKDVYSKCLLAGLYPSIKEEFVKEVTEEMIQSLNPLYECSNNERISFFQNVLPDRREDYISGRKKPILKNRHRIPPRYMYGGNWSTPRDVFEELGGLDENFKGWGGEDFDYARRAREKHVDIFIDFDAIGYHLDHPTINRDKTKHIGKGYFNEKWNQ